MSNISVVNQKKCVYFVIVMHYALHISKGINQKIENIPVTF